MALKLKSFKMLCLDLVDFFITAIYGQIYVVTLVFLCGNFGSLTPQINLQYMISIKCCIFFFAFFLNSIYHRSIIKFLFKDYKLTLKFINILVHRTWYTNKCFRQAMQQFYILQLQSCEIEYFSRKKVNMTIKTIILYSLSGPFAVAVANKVKGWHILRSKNNFHVLNNVI